jgi:hypothetical protein
MKNLSKAELTELFKMKIREDQKIPIAKSIDKDKRFPSYRTFKRIFGGKRIREIDELKEIIKESKIKIKIDQIFCEACVLEKESGNVKYFV